MKRVVKDKTDIVSPDRTRVGSFGIDFKWEDEQAIPFSYDGGQIYYCEKGRNHTDIFYYLKKRDDTFDLRYYPAYGLMLVWVYDGVDVIGLLKDFKMAYEEGNIINVDSVDRHRYELPDIDYFTLLFIERGTDGQEYVVTCNFNELDEVNEFEDNFEFRQFHILSPLLKRKMLSENERMREEKHQYYLESERSWLRKYGNIDPALYHLLAYEE